VSRVARGGRGQEPLRDPGSRRGVEPDETRHSRCGHLAGAQRQADEIWESEVDDLRALWGEPVKEREMERVRS
jgi:hypothetical protein